MKIATVTLDAVLHRILMEEELHSFTILELRDLYLRHVKPNGNSHQKVRMYIYDQIRRMIDLRWVSYHSERKARGQRFVIHEMPEHVRLKLTAPKIGMVEMQIPKEVPSNLYDLQSNNDVEQNQDQDTRSDNLTTATLKEMLKDVRLDFLTNLGATERYRLLMDEVPELKNTLEPELLAARDKSSKLLGHMKALEVTLQKLGVA